MEKGISLAMKTFLLHLKDILALYCPNLVSEFLSFEKGLLKAKNRLQTHQTLQFYFNQIKKGTTDKKLKSIITVWKSKFKNSFIEDKNLLYLVLMYLFYQIETSVDFLIEGGRLSPSHKDSKEKELKDQCIEKLSLKAETKLTYEEYNDIINQPEITKEDFKDPIDKAELKEKGKDEEHSPELQTNLIPSEENIEETAHSSNQVIVNGTSSVSLSLEEKISAMEEKISRLIKVEEEFNTLKQEVKDLKESFSYFQSKCHQYETIKLIKAFIKHLCLIFDIPYSSYRIAFIIDSLKTNPAFQSYTKGRKVEASEIEDFISIYYDLKVKLAIDPSSNNSPINDFISKYSSMFSSFSFSPEKGELLNYSAIQHIKSNIIK